MAPDVSRMPPPIFVQNPIDCAPVDGASSDQVLCSLSFSVLPLETTKPVLLQAMEVETIEADCSAVAPFVTEPTGLDSPPIGVSPSNNAR